MLKSNFLFIISLVMVITITSGIACAGKPDIASIVKSVETGKKVMTNVIRLTTNRNEFVQLDEDASSVIVNNPAHASVMLDTPRLLIVVPHQPGATSFTVLDKNGKTILQKDILVSNVEKKYVRVRRMCGTDPTCRPDSYYYCPDGCYEVTTVENNGGQGAAPLRPTGASSMIDDTANDDGQNGNNTAKASSNNGDESSQQNNNNPEQSEDEPLPEE